MWYGKSAKKKAQSVNQKKPLVGVWFWFLPQILVNGFIVEMLHVSTDDSRLKEVFLKEFAWNVLSVFINTIENKFKIIANILTFKDGMAKILWNLIPSWKQDIYQTTSAQSLFILDVILCDVNYKVLEKFWNDFTHHMRK